MPSVTHTIIDNAGETSTTRFYLPTISGANYDTVAGNGATDNVGALRLAVAAITRGNFVRHTVSAVEYPEAGTLPADPEAHRETKLLVSYVDNVNARRGSVTIAAPDLSILAQTGTDVVDHTSNAAAIALTTAIETYAASRDGNAITVIGMRIVGRNI